MWATIWLAGAVVFTLGYPQMTPDQCDQLAEVIVADIEAGIVERDTDGDGVKELWVLDSDSDELLPWDEWSVTCESQQLPIGTPQIQE